MRSGRLKIPNRYGERSLLARGGVRSQEGPRQPRRVRFWILANDSLPRLLGARRIAQARVTESDLHERVRRLARSVFRHLLELDQRLAIVALRPVRLADPVLSVPRQRVLGMLRDEVDEIEYGLSMLARAIRGERRVVFLLGIARARCRGRRRRGLLRLDGGDGRHRLGRDRLRHPRDRGRGLRAAAPRERAVARPLRWRTATVAAEAALERALGLAGRPAPGSGLPPAPASRPPRCPPSRRAGRSAGALRTRSVPWPAFRWFERRGLRSVGRRGRDRGR